MIKQYDLIVHNLTDKEKEVVLFGGMQLQSKPSTITGKEILIYSPLYGKGGYEMMKEDYLRNASTITSLVFSETVETEIHSEDYAGRVFIRKIVCQKDKLYRRSDGLFLLNPTTIMCLTLAPKQRIDIMFMAAVHAYPVKS